MLTILFLLVIAFVIFKDNYKETNLLPLISIFFPLLIFLFFVYEVEFTSLGFFVSDEVNYFESIKGEHHVLDRIFWYSLNQFLLEIDIFGELAVKLISIPILFFTLYMLWAIFYKDNRIFLIAIILPYLPWIATKNLRDIFIMFFSVSVLFVFYKVKNKWFAIVPLFLLFLIRPFICFILFFLILYDLYIKEALWHSIKISILKPKLIIKTSFFKHFAIIVVVFFVAISIPHINKRINSYWRYFVHYTTGEGYFERQQKREGLSTGNYFLDYGYGVLRYVFSPNPIALGKRITQGGTPEWGVVDDTIRLINQLFYYWFLAYVLLNYKSIYGKFKKLKPEIKILIILFLCYLPLYTFYGFGAGHQRIKLPFQLAVFLLYLLNKNDKIGKIIQTR